MIVKKQTGIIEFFMQIGFVVRLAVAAQIIPNATEP